MGVLVGRIRSRGWDLISEVEDGVRIREGGAGRSSHNWLGGRWWYLALDRVRGRGGGLGAWEWLGDGGDAVNDDAISAIDGASRGLDDVRACVAVGELGQRLRHRGVGLVRRLQFIPFAVHDQQRALVGARSRRRARE